MVSICAEQTTKMAQRLPSPGHHGADSDSIPQSDPLEGQIQNRATNFVVSFPFRGAPYSGACAPSGFPSPWVDRCRVPKDAGKDRWVASPAGSGNRCSSGYMRKGEFSDTRPPQRVLAYSPLAVSEEETRPGYRRGYRQRKGTGEPRLNHSLDV